MDQQGVNVDSAAPTTAFGSNWIGWVGKGKWKKSVQSQDMMRNDFDDADKNQKLISKI